VKFSIRGILLATTFIAVLLAAFVAPLAIGAAIILLLWPLIATMVVGVAIYSRGTWQAFAIGAAVPMSMLGAANYLFLGLIVIESTSTILPSYTELVDGLSNLAPGIRVLAAISGVATLICGALNVGMRWLYREPSPSSPPNTHEIS
jgi:hypothetical protein